MDDFRTMNATQIKEYLEKHNCSLENAQEIFCLEAEGEERPDVISVVGDYIMRLSRPSKPDKPSRSKKKG